MGVGFPLKIQGGGRGSPTRGCGGGGGGRVSAGNFGAGLHWTGLPDKNIDQIGKNVTQSQESVFAGALSVPV